MLPLSAIRCHPWLLASLVGNGMLAAVLLISWTRQANPQPGVAARLPELNAVPEVPQAPSAGTAATAANAREENKAAFHWSQLDAPDFATFVRNLRGVGCPEATIQDIIAGELREIYAAKRLSAEQALAAAPEAARAELQERARSLGMEEAALLASLTGGVTGGAPSTAEPAFADLDGAPAAAAGNESKTTPSATTADAAHDSLLTPAAFLVGNDPSRSSGFSDLPLVPDDAALDPRTTQVITQLRQDFAQALPEQGAVGGEDSSSLLYRMRWQAAQRQSDEAFSSLFGGDAFLRIQTEAMQKQQAQVLAR